MIDLQTAHADDLLSELVQVRRSVEQLTIQREEALNRLDAVYAAIEAKADKFNEIVHSMSNQPLETAVAGARRRSAK